MFKKVLVANRGEIAVRIIRALREMGIKSVAVYSTADRLALHTVLADEAVCIGPPRVADSYNHKIQLLSAALTTGAEAIHPGFGFLSENSQFAKMCEECDITFIGPSSEAIHRMGNKAVARETMIKAGVPVIPGSEGFIDDCESGLELAKSLGFPVMLKAAAGGGGKGMREIHSEEQFKQLFDQVKLEAGAVFSDDQVYLEKIITHARHIEVQILGDSFGNVIHLGERECSLQRQHQKVLEEAPSSFISSDVREQLGKAAVDAAIATHYVNAGTVEFLVDQNQNFYFMEMNTRLQVEHPVTEMVTGVDIVNEQIRIASGLPLIYSQEDIKITGHAIECRINAEDPTHDFRPASGKITDLILPSGSLGLRVESALFAGSGIPPFYDSMVAKVITYAKTRDIAFRKMNRALMEFMIDGIPTNIDFQLALIADKGVLSGAFDTHYLEEHFLSNFLKAHKQSVE